MQQNYLNKIIFFVGSPENLSNIEEEPGLPPFSDEVIKLLDELSKSLMADSKAKRFSDIVTYAYWCRKASILRMREKYDDELAKRKGRGVSFHIAPSNIPMMFMFSLTASLLAGNLNIIRLSSRAFEQTKIVCDHLNRILAEKGLRIKKFITIFNYPHDDEITKELSLICDSRIIWGGNSSVNKIRSFAIKASAIDMPFYDRFSFCVITAKKYLESDIKNKIAKRFYNDTYLTDQNACTSPQLVCWIGNRKDVERAKELFWNSLMEEVNREYLYQDVQSVDKYMALCRYAISHVGGNCKLDNMKVVRVKIEESNPDIMDYRCPGGYFYEYESEDLSGISDFCINDAQTIAYYGVEKEEILNITSKKKGVDRVVEIGQTMDFGLRWDGFDFISFLTKVVG